MKRIIIALFWIFTISYSILYWIFIIGLTEDFGNTHEEDADMIIGAFIFYIGTTILISNFIVKVYEKKIKKKF